MQYCAFTPRFSFPPSLCRMSYSASDEILKYSTKGASRVFFLCRSRLVYASFPTQHACPLLCKLFHALLFR